MSNLKNIFKQALKNEKLLLLGKLTTNDFYVNTNGMSYKEFKKLMKLKGLTANDKEARSFFYTQLDPDIVPVELEEIIQRPTLPSYEEYYDVKKALQTPIIINPVTPTGNVAPKLKKWYEGQDWSGDFRGIPANSGSSDYKISEKNNSKTSSENSSKRSLEESKRWYGHDNVLINPMYTAAGEFWSNLLPSWEYLRDATNLLGNNITGTARPVITKPDKSLYRYLALDGRIPQNQQGGKMNKFQQGGKTSSQQDAVMQFVKALAQTLQADPQLVIQAALLNPEALKSAIQVYQESKGDIQKAAQAFSLVLLSQTQAAKHGAKLNYLKSLKNKCAEDEELYYFKKGGSIGCGCKKKEQGGELKGKKESIVSKFKKACGGSKMKFMAGGLSPKKKNLDQASKDSIEINDKQNMELMSERPGKLIPNPKYDKGKTDDRALLWVPDRTKTPYKKEEKVKKDCGGSKMKLQKGDKVCPKCGKVHAAGAGCMLSSVKKFKMHKLGGSLNGVPFIRKLQ